MNISELFKAERKWYQTRAKLKKGYATVFCRKIRLRLSWDWAKADYQWKAHARSIADHAASFVSDHELEKFLNNQNLKIK